jgi:hypothetical protein
VKLRLKESSVIGDEEAAMTNLGFGTVLMRVSDPFPLGACRLFTVDLARKHLGTPESLWFRDLDSRAGRPGRKAVEVTPV